MKRLGAMTILTAFGVVAICVASVVHFIVVMADNRLVWSNAADARLALESASDLAPEQDERARQRLSELQAELRRLETGR